MEKRALSARAAGLYLGFSSANPILAAIRDGELTATRRDGGRNGRNTNAYLIERTELDRWAAARGLEPPASTPAPEKGVDEPETLNVARIVPLRAPDAPIAPAVGLVTIPIEHYAQLVADRAELRLLREHPELLTRKGK